MKQFKPGYCSRCNSQNIIVENDKVICQDCNDWAWLEDAIDSCWNGYVNEEQNNSNEAQWVDRDGNPSIGEDKRNSEIFCSNCKKIALGYPFWECDLYPSIYCPHCGKKMKNGKEYEYKDDNAIANY